MIRDISLVSVVMPTYNQSQFIAQAIESVLNQAYGAIELIIVDNYSDDNTYEIVRSFKDQRIRYFKFKNNGIIAASRNFGIRKSTGKFIAFLDSDDVWFEGKIMGQVELLNKDTAIGLSFSPFQIDSPDKFLKGRIIGSYGKKIYGYLHNSLIKYNFITLSSAIVRASTLNAIGVFDESPDIVRAEDFDLWLRIARKYKIASSGEVMGIYRMHMSNQSLECDCLKRAFNVIDKHFKKGWIPEAMFRRAKTNLICREGWNFAGSKDNNLSRKLFYTILKENWYVDIGMTLLSCLGMLLSLFPEFCVYLKKRSIDKKFKNIAYATMLNRQFLKREGKWTKT